MYPGNLSSAISENVSYKRSLIALHESGYGFSGFSCVLHSLYLDFLDCTPFETFLTKISGQVSVK